MRLVEQWEDVRRALPRGWHTASLTLTVADPDAAERAALVLGPAAPGRHDSSFRLHVARAATPGYPSADLLRRVLARLDREGIGGRLGAAGAEEEGTGAEATPGPLASQWEVLLAALPADWSHLLAQLDLDSSDYVSRGALLLAPANPQISGGRRSFRFRSARTVGYGVATEMARRCLERLDRERITGQLSLVHVVSDARPVGTQGPVWRIGHRSV